MERESREVEGRRAKSSGSERKTVAYATDETKLWLRPSAAEILVLGPHLSTRI